NRLRPSSHEPDGEAPGAAAPPRRAGRLDDARPPRSRPLPRGDRPSRPGSGAADDGGRAEGTQGHPPGPARPRPNGRPRPRSLSAAPPPMNALPLLPATVIGSWSFPGWYTYFCEEVRLHPERFGPDDREEAVRDAVRLAIEDQLQAGADLISD